MLKASIDYALANRREVFSAVGTQANIDPSFFEWWFDRTTEIPGMFGEEHARAVTRAWEIGQRFAMIQRVPDVGQLTWEHTLRS
jgi:NitT/TauT family transport system substrate-binding protein